jgi:hypothetical protein
VESSKFPIDRELYRSQPYNRQDPNVWDILYLDRAIPIDSIALAYTVKDLQNWTRNYLLIPIKVFANICLAAIMVIKRLLPLSVSCLQFYASIGGLVFR